MDIPNCITVLMIAKDNETYLKYFVQKMELVETLYHCTFQYFFYENDSKDKSREILQGFLTGRDGQLFTGSWPPFENKGHNFERTHRLATLRNELVSKCKDLIKGEWTLLIDTDIYFGNDVIKRFFSYPLTSENIGMIAGFSTEAFTADHIKKQLPNSAIQTGEVVSTNHYYDTFAFVDKDGHNYWPNCKFECKFCKGPKKPIDATPLLDVTSCYGGFALIETAILKHPNVRWGTINLSDRTSLCEHLLFCQAIKNCSSKRIVIATEVRDIFWINCI